MVNLKSAGPVLVPAHANGESRFQVIDEVPILASEKQSVRTGPWCYRYGQSALDSLAVPCENQVLEIVSLSAFDIPYLALIEHWIGCPRFGSFGVHRRLVRFHVGGVSGEFLMLIPVVIGLSPYRLTGPANLLQPIEVGCFRDCHDIGPRQRMKM